MREKIHPLPDLNVIIEASRGETPVHESLVLFFERWWSLDRQPQLGEYRLLYVALKELLPKVEWPKEEFKWWVNHKNCALITKQETFHRLYLSRFGPFFEAGDYVKEYEEGRGKDYLRKNNISAICAEARKQGKPATKAEAGARKGKKTGDDCNVLSNRGNDPIHLARRIFGADEQIFNRLEQGEFKSVRAAAIEAGVVKVKPTSQIEVAKKAWKRMNEVERNEFLSWISEV